MKVTLISFITGAHRTIPKDLVKKLEDLEIGRETETTRTTRITKIGQNTERSRGNLRRFAVAQTSGKDHQKSLV